MKTDDKVSLSLKPGYGYTLSAFSAPKPVGQLYFEEIHTVVPVFKKPSRIWKWAVKFFFNAKYREV